MINSNVAAEAKRSLEVSPGEGSLASAIAVLARAGVERPTIRGWALDAVRDYGLALDPDTFNRCFARGLQRAMPPAPEEPEDAVSEPPIEVRPPARSYDFAGAPVFQSAETMLAICLDAEGVRTRLDQMKAGLAEFAAAQDQLAADRAQFDAHVAAAQAALAAREKRVQARELAMLQQEPQLREARNRVKELSEKIDRMTGRFEVLPGGAVREFCQPDRTDDGPAAPSPGPYVEKDPPPRARAGRRNRHLSA